MARYQILYNNSIYDNDTSKIIPNNSENSDYAAYLAWVDLGNTADPYVAPSDNFGSVDPTIFTDYGEKRSQSISVSAHGFINGDFDIAQRGTTFTNVSNEQYTLDRWRFEKSGNMEYTVSQEVDVPSYIESFYPSEHSIKLTCTTNSTTTGATDYVCLTQPIEGNMIIPFLNITVTLSFWVKASIAGTYCVAASNRLDTTYIAEYTISEANTWQRVVIIYPTPTIAGTLSTGDEVGIYMSWMLSCGTSYHGPNTTWTNAIKYSTDNQVNQSETTNSTFHLSQVKLDADVGSTAFVGKPHAETLFECQRYYEKSYSINTPIQTATLSNIQRVEVIQSVVGLSCGFIREKRVSPTMQYFDDQGVLSKITGWDSSDTKTSGIAPESFYLAPTSTRRFLVNATVSSTYTNVGFHWTADAEL